MAKGPNILQSWLWKRRIARMKRCRTPEELTKRCGKPHHTLEEDGITFWHYPLKVIAGTFYAIHVAFLTGAPAQAYVHVTPGVSVSDSPSSAQTPARQCSDRSRCRMKALKSLHPVLSAALQRCSAGELVRFLGELLPKTAPSFRDVEAIRPYCMRIERGEPLTEQDSQKLLALSEILDAEYAELDAEGRIEESEETFRQARYTYALSLAVKGVSAEAMDDILYELAYAHEDGDAFLSGAFELLQRNE